jgi:hypothetical protein
MTGGGIVDAGYYYGDGSYWADGAYPPPSDAASGQTDDAEVIDASPGCAALAACCPTLTGSSQALCDLVAQGGNTANCATELSQLQAEGDCTGATVLASQVQVPPSRLVSDGTMLFWTTTGSPGLLAMPVGGGPITTVLAGPVGDFLAVDDLNVYVLQANGVTSASEAIQLWNIIRIPKDGGAATLVNEAGAQILAASTTGTTAYWLESQVPVGSGWDLPLAIKSGALLGGPISLVAQWMRQANPPGEIGVTSSSVFMIEQIYPQYLQQVFPISAGPGAEMSLSGGPSACAFLAADTDAVYCSQTTDSNYRIANDGTAVALGSAVSSSYVVFDDTNAYWAEETAVGTIVRAPKAGGGNATVIARDANPTAIAIDANSVYWGDQAGYIMSMPK